MSALDYAKTVRSLTGIGCEHDTDGGRNAAHRQLQDSWGCTRDLDLVDWGLAVGIAYAARRLQCPGESEQDSEAHAYDAAHDLCREASGPVIIARRISPGERVDQALLAFHRADHLPSEYADLGDALTELTEAYGVPCEPPGITITDDDATVLLDIAEDRTATAHARAEGHDDHPEGRGPRAAQLRLCADLTEYADSRAVPHDRISVTLGIVRLWRGKARDQLGELLEEREAQEVLKQESAATAGDIASVRKDIAATEALMERLGDDPHAKPYAGGER